MSDTARPQASRFLADPTSVLAVAAGIALGGVGATYPTTLLGEHHAPGPAAGVLLGLVAALGTAPLWILPIAVESSAGATARALRLIRHAHGQSVATTRAADVRRCVARTLLGVLAGGAGGLLSALLQWHAVGRAVSAGSLAPSPRAVATALVIAAATIVFGYVLGTVAADTSTALVAVVSVLAVSAVLLGATYFAPGFGPVASATPLGGLLVAAKDQLFAPQFTRELTTTPALIGAVLWTTALLALYARRIRNQVA
jgi:hypothetical protein